MSMVMFSPFFMGLILFFLQGAWCESKWQRCVDAGGTICWRHFHHNSRISGGQNWSVQNIEVTSSSSSSISSWTTFFVNNPSPTFQKVWKEKESAFTWLFVCVCLLSIHISSYDTEVDIMWTSGWEIFYPFFLLQDGLQIRDDLLFILHRLVPVWMGCCPNISSVSHYWLDKLVSINPIKLLPCQSLSPRADA